MLYFRSHNLAGIETHLTSDQIDLDAVQPPDLIGLDSDIAVYDNGHFAHLEGDDIRFEVLEEEMRFIAPSELFRSGKTLYYLAEMVAEQKRQRHGGALIHGAGVYLPEQRRGVLVLGEKGAGKTSTVTGLCVEIGAQLIGNDQVILGAMGTDLQMVDGTKAVRIRQTAAMQDNVLSGLVKFGANDSLPNWDRKKELSPSEAGIITADRPHLITDAIQVVMDRTLDKVIVRRNVRDVQMLLYLSELTSRHIKGVATPVLDDTGELRGLAPSLDTPETVTNRTHLINTLVNKLGVSKIYGPSMRHIIEEVMRLA